MSRKKRFLSLFLSIVMILGTLPAAAFAAGDNSGLSNFSKQKTFSEDIFADVKSENWFYENVKTAYELGLMIGVSETNFNPSGNLSIAETVTIAARLHSIYQTGADKLVAGSPWYQTYVDYAKANGIIASDYPDYKKAATRAEFAMILAAALPKEALTEKNTVADDVIPDVRISDSFGNAVYLLYRAGILTGNDNKGTFAPESNIQRCEVAAIVSRMADISLRQTIAWGEKDNKPDSTGGSIDWGSPVNPTPTPPEPEDPAHTITVDYEFEDGRGEVVLYDISDSSYMSRTAGIVGKPVSVIATGGKLNYMTLKYKVDSAMDELAKADKFSWAVYNTDLDLVELVPTTYDASKMTLMADLNNFCEAGAAEQMLADDGSEAVATASSIQYADYCLVNLEDWNAAWSLEQYMIRDTEDTSKVYNILFMLDVSGSMGWKTISSSSKTRLETEIESTNAFIDRLLDGDTVSIVAFHEKTTALFNKIVLSPESREQIKQSLSGLTAGGGTSFNNALEDASKYFKTPPITENGEDQQEIMNMMVFISDGESDLKDDIWLPTWEPIITVGIGEAADSKLLKEIAGKSRTGRYIGVENVEELTNILELLQSEFVGSTVDTDGDGIPDIVEITGIRDQYGKLHKTDPNSADTDGDGIPDGKEIDTKPCQDWQGHIYYRLITTPEIPTFFSDEVRWRKNYKNSIGKLKNASDKDSEENQGTGLLVGSHYNDEYTALSIEVYAEAEAMYIASDNLSETIYSMPDNWHFHIKEESSFDSIDNEIGRIYRDEFYETHYGDPVTGNTEHLIENVIVGTSMVLHAPKDRAIDFSICLEAKNAETLSRQLKMDGKGQEVKDLYEEAKDLESRVEGIENKAVENIQELGKAARKSIENAKDKAQKDLQEKENKLVAVSFSYSSTTQKPETNLEKQIKKEINAWYRDNYYQKVKEKAEEKLSTSAEELMNQLFEFVEVDFETTFSYNQYEYTLKITGNMYNGLPSPSLEATVTSKRTRNQWEYTVTAGKTTVEDAISSYQKQLRELYGEAGKDAIEAVINDAYSVVGVDNIIGVAKKICKEATYNWLSGKVGKYGELLEKLHNSDVVKQLEKEAKNIKDIKDSCGAVKWIITSKKFFNDETIPNIKAQLRGAFNLCDSVKSYLERNYLN